MERISCFFFNLEQQKAPEERCYALPESSEIPPWRYCVKWSVKWVHLTFLQWIMHIIGTLCICHQFTLTCAHATAGSSQKSDSSDKSQTVASLVSFAEACLNRSSNLTLHFSLPFIQRYISHLKDACQAH